MEQWATMQAYFRDAVGTDLPAIGAILRGSANASDGAPVGSYRDALTEIDRTDGNYVLVAEYDRQIIAVLQLLAFRHLHDRSGHDRSGHDRSGHDRSGHDRSGQDRSGRTAQIVLLRVATEFRTSGIAGMLIDHAAARARDLGCRRLEALTSTAATDEHPEWERAGFVHLDRGYVRQLP